ncbi:MAG TPA: PAS domain S-box protein [Solirubrobacteraceae bacterium]
MNKGTLRDRVRAVCDRIRTRADRRLAEPDGELEECDREESRLDRAHELAGDQSLVLAERVAGDLAQQRTRLMEAQSIAQLGSWEWDVTTDRIEWSDELCRIYGLRRGHPPASFDEYMGLLHPDDRPRVEASLHASYAGAKPFAFKHRIVRPDGSVRVLNGLGEVISGDDGQVLRMLGTGQDITERERMEAELRRSSRYFELSRDLTVACGFDGYFKSVNPALEHVLGWSTEEFLARPFADMVHVDDRAVTLAQVEKLAGGQTTSSFVNRLVARDGSYRWLDWNAIVPPEEELIYASARDVTERVSAEAALAASERQTRQILQTAHESFVAIDARGVITDWNSAAEATFGWSRAEALGRELADTIVPESLRDAHRSGLQRLRAGGETRVIGRPLELSAVDRHGREFPVELAISAVVTEDGHAFNAFLRDISERREAEDEIQRSRRLSERLLGAQRAISRVFAQAQSSDEAMRGLLVALGEAMEWELGAWWSCEDASEALRCRSFWCGDPAFAPEFEEVTRKLELPLGVALPGRVWATGEPAWTGDLAADISFPRSRAAARAGLHAALCVPVIAESEFCGVVEFFSTRVGEPDRATRQIFVTIAEQIGGFMTVLDQRSELLGKLKRLALTDELTGLGNRRAWQESLGRELARARRHGDPLCVAMLDVDHFKRFNDAHGHQAGDRLLRQVAQTWRGQVRASDILARYGGEEFALAFPACPLEAAEAVLARLRSAVGEDQTCSAGVAVFDGFESAEELVGRADAALYEAKAQGRDRTVIAIADRFPPQRDFRSR